VLAGHPRGRPAACRGRR